MSTTKETVKRVLRNSKRLRSVYCDSCPVTRLVPVGHFYSAIPSDQDLEIAKATTDSALGGIDLREKEQLELIGKLRPHYRAIPDFPYEQGSTYRFCYNNHYYSYPDTTVLACLLQHKKPRRFIDVGGGNTTFLMLDLNDTLFKADPVRLDVIEPYPEKLKKGLRLHDRVTLHAEKAQKIDPALFRELERDDVLFLDTTHVSKLGSEVDYIMFQILPLLKSGVRIHVHEMFYPFTYPESFFSDGKFWNEIYLWRAFLMNNAGYEIELFNSFLEQKHRGLMQESFPKYFEKGDPSIVIQNLGSSLWIRKR